MVSRCSCDATRIKTVLLEEYVQDVRLVKAIPFDEEDEHVARGDLSRKVGHAHYPDVRL